MDITPRRKPLALWTEVRCAACHSGFAIAPKETFASPSLALPWPLTCPVPVVYTDRSRKRLALTRPWPRRFFSNSAARTPSDIDFARSCHHPLSTTAPLLLGFPRLGRCPSFRCSPVPANSAPTPSAGFSADPTARPPRPPALGPCPAPKLLS